MGIFDDDEDSKALEYFLRTFGEFIIGLSIVAVVLLVVCIANEYQRELTALFRYIGAEAKEVFNSS